MKKDRLRIQTLEASNAELKAEIERLNQKILTGKAPRQPSRWKTIYQLIDEQFAQASVSDISAKLHDDLRHVLIHTLDISGQNIHEAKMELACDMARDLATLVMKHRLKHAHPK
jgi:hypothetical protein